MIDWLKQISDWVWGPPLLILLMERVSSSRSVSA